MRYLAIVVALVGVAHADSKTKAITSALSSGLSVSSDEANLPPVVLLDNETKLKEAVPRERRS